MSFPRAGAGNQTSVLWKAASALNGCATSEATEHFFFQKHHRKELDWYDDGETEIYAMIDSTGGTNIFMKKKIALLNYPEQTVEECLKQC